MDFQSAMETFAEAWVVANAKTAVLEPPLQNEALSLTCAKRPSSPTPNKILIADSVAMYGKDASSINNKTPVDKSLPVHCIVETIYALEDSDRDNWRRKSQIETDSYVIIPVNTPIQELLVVALTRLGYPKETSAIAKGAILLRNWRPLSFDTISPSPLATVGELLAELSTVATLRIQILRPRGSLIQEMKDKLLKLLLSQNHGLLMRSGCPLDTLTLLNLCRESGTLHHQSLNEPTEEISAKFEAWVANQLNSPCLQQQQQQQHPLASPTFPSHLPVHHHRLSSSSSSPRKDDLAVMPASMHAGAHVVQKTRMRTSFDPELELPKLQKWFHENQHPSRQQIQQYVKELNSLECRRGRKPLDVNNVVYWFKNARAAQKRAELRGFCAPLAPLLNMNGFQNFHNTVRSQPGSVAPSDQPSMSDDDLSRTSDLDHQIDVNDSDAEMPLSLTNKAEAEPEQEKVVKHEPNRDEEEEAVSSPKLKPDNSPKDRSSPLEDEQNNNVAKDSDPHGEDTSISDDEDVQDDERSLDLRKETSDSTRSPSPTSLSSRLHHGFPLVPNSMFSHSIMYMSHYMPGLSPMATPSRDQSLLLSQDERRKRNRTFIDPVTEVPRLEQWFLLNTHPSHNLILKYTDELNRMPYRQKFPRLEPKNVQFWFKNRRAKCKRLKMSLFENSSQGSHYPTN